MSTHKLTSTVTSARGTFTLHVPTGVLGFAYAGPPPDANHATFVADGKSYVRGVIGASQSKSLAYSVYQGHEAATSSRLGDDSGTLRFDLQRAGTLTGTSAQLIGQTYGVQVERLNGSDVEFPAKPNGSGTFTTHTLVPGRYRLSLTPDPAYLPKTLDVTVHAGRSASVPIGTFTRGAVLSGNLSSDNSPLTSSVHVSVEEHGTTTSIAEAESGPSGSYSIAGLHAGTYDVVFGRNPRPDPDADPIVPYPAVTSDAYVATTRTITIDSAHDDVTGDYSLAAAAQLTGTVSGVSRAVAIDVEQSDHSIVRETETDSDGTFTIGGLVAGTHYTVYADTAQTGVAESGTTYGSTPVTPEAGMNGPISIDAAAHPTLRLSAARGSSSAAVGLQATQDLSAKGPSLGFAVAGSPSTKSTYLFTGLIPGRYSLTDEVFGHIAPRATTITLTTSATENLAIGARFAVLKARFVSGSAPVLFFEGAAASRTGKTIGFSRYNGSFQALEISADSDSALNGDVFAGTYHFTQGSFTGPATDGPWWFGAPGRSFKVAPGRTTDIGTISLTIHSSLR